METRDFLSKFGHFEYHKDLELLPWKIESNIDPADMYWRMGKGEDIIIRFNKFYNALSNRDKEIIKLSYPPPIYWSQFYD